MKPTKSLFVTAAWILGTMGVSASASSSCEVTARSVPNP